jgi:predicted amidohydrolase
MILKAAIIQLNAKPSIEENMQEAEGLIRAAAAGGARFIATPENTCRMRAKPEDKWASSYEEQGHPAVKFYAGLAKQLGIHLLIGSISSIRVEGEKLANRSYLFGTDGETIATYDKIHMFDVDLPNGDKYRESDTNAPGDRAVVADIDGVRIGMSVCYDVRFPHLYRMLAKEGAQILTIPAAFTVPTGQAHWEVLLRARAIENGAFVVAPAQGGIHEGGRATWGHSMIISPWGEILAQIQGDGAGYAIADLDLEAVSKARGSIPSIANERFFTN